MAQNMSVRLSLKYDTYANWIANDPILLKGEMAITEIPADSSSGLQEPTIVAKVGTTGTKKWSEEGWLSGTSADIIQSLKGNSPSLPATSITGLDDYLEGHGAIDTNTTYQLVAAGDMGIKLQYKNIGDESWTDGATITLTPPTYELTSGTANGTVAFNGVDVAVTGIKSAAFSEASAFDAAGAADAAKAEVIGETGDASTKMTLYGVKAYTNAGLATKQDTVAFDPNSAYNADTNKAATLGSISREVGAAKTELIGTSADPSSANTINAAKKYADEKIASQVSSVYKAAGSTAFADLPEPAANIVGNVYNVTDAFEADTKFVTGEQGNSYPAGTNVAVIEVEDNYFYDVLAGFVDMSSYSTTEQMNAAIDADVAAAKTELIGTGDATSTTIKAAVAEAKTYADGLNTAMDARVDALETAVGESGDINSRLTQAESDITALETLTGEGGAIDTRMDGIESAATALTGRVDTLEESSHTHANKALLDTYTQTEANLADAVAKKHEHANKTVLDAITSGKVAAWDAAETNAKGYADSLNSAMNGRVGTLETTITQKVAYTDELILNCGSSNTNVFTAG